MTENDRVLYTLARAREWLGRPNRSATTWRVGDWNVEIAYVAGEGSLSLWLDGHKPGRRIRTRGRDVNDTSAWIETLQACRGRDLAPS